MKALKFKNQISPTSDGFNFGLLIAVLALVIILLFSQKKYEMRDGSHDGCYGFPQPPVKKLVG